MEKINNMMLSLLRAEVCGIETDITELEKGEAEALYDISKKHDLVHIISYALEKRELLPNSPISEKFKNEHIMAFFRHQKLVFELERLCKAFEEAGIEHIPLKGAVMRDYYPESWFRTSCDIDVLVKKEQLEKAEEVLKKQLGAKKDGESRHDIAYFTDNKIKIELHFSLVADNKNYKFEAELLKVWDYAKPASGWKYRCVLEDEMFYLFHIAHIAVHFKEGGCGIKPILDLFFLENKMEFDINKRNELIENSGLVKCCENSRALSRVWFGTDEETDITKRMGDFILSGGVYGSVANRIILQNELSKGKVRYLLSRIFLPYDRLKYQYPVIQARKWLYPLFTLVRWSRLIFVRGNTKRQLTELKYVNGVEGSVPDNMKNMLKDMDI